MKSYKYIILISVLFCFLSLIGNVSAELDEITGMKIPETEITMEIGDLYTFNPQFSTIEVSGAYSIELHIFSSDDSVVEPVEKINPKELKDLSGDAYEEAVANTLNTIKAVGGGTATVMLYSDNYKFSHVCTVKVNGPVAVKKDAKAVWDGPTSAQLKKVKDPALKAYFTMLDRPDMASAASELAKNAYFKTLITVTPGSQKKLAAKFEKLGMEQVYAFTEIDMVSVYGTPEQYLRVLEENNVLSIIEDEKGSVDSNNISFLRGSAESLVQVAKARNAGLTGAGTAVAIIDTGINPSHEQFTKKAKGKIILQACFSTMDTANGYYYSCKNGKGKDLTSAEVGSQVSYPDDFNHGIHVAGIAAGKDGVASEASIIAVNVFSEYWKYANGKIEHDNTAFYSDQIRALEYLLGKLGSSGRKVKVGGVNYTVASVNFSLGGGAYSSTCNTDIRQPYMKKLLNRGIVPVATSGNYYYNGYIGAPACISSVFAVGALNDSSTPSIASFSNHSKLVNILAPGVDIWSSTTGTNKYEYMSGTSMAAPMVSGAVALIRQGFPQLTGPQIRTMLAQMSLKTASRNGIEKKVLNFNRIATYKNLLASTAKISGGNKFLRITLPIGKANKPVLTAKVYKCSASRTNCTLISSPKVSVSKGAKSTVVKIKGLSNNTVYKVVLSGNVTFGSKKYNINNKIRYGMPVPAYTKGKVYSDGIILNWAENSRYTKHQLVVYKAKNGKKTGSPVMSYMLDDDTYSGGVWVVGLSSRTQYYLSLRHISVVKGKTYYGKYKSIVFTTK